mgnify:CR=1 FL=1
MSRNAIVIFSANRPNMLAMCLSTVAPYCKKYGIDLRVVSDLKYNFNIPGYNSINFEKNQVYSYFDSYDRILRLDHDTLITKA